jgi:hypothetical protein
MEVAFPRGNFPEFPVTPSGLSRSRSKVENQHLKSTDEGTHELRSGILQESKAPNIANGNKK